MNYARNLIYNRKIVLFRQVVFEQTIYQIKNFNFWIAENERFSLYVFKNNWELYYGRELWTFP